MGRITLGTCLKKITIGTRWEKRLGGTSPSRFRNRAEIAEFNRKVENVVKLFIFIFASFLRQAPSVIRPIGSEKFKQPNTANLSEIKH